MVPIIVRQVWQGGKDSDSERRGEALPVQVASEKTISLTGPADMDERLIGLAVDEAGEGASCNFQRAAGKPLKAKWRERMVCYGVLPPLLSGKVSDRQRVILSS